MKNINRKLNRYTAILYLNSISDTLVYQTTLLANSRGNALHNFGERLKNSGIDILINKKDKIKILPFKPETQLITIKETINE